MGPDQGLQSQNSDGNICGHTPGRDASPIGARLIESFLGNGRLSKPLPLERCLEGWERRSKRRKNRTYQSETERLVRCQYTLGPKPSDARYTPGPASLWAVCISHGPARDTQICRATNELSFGCSDVVGGILVRSFHLGARSWRAEFCD